MHRLGLDTALVDAVLRSTTAGLELTGLKPRAVGVGVLPPRLQDVSVVIGMVGRRSGTVTLNLSQRAAVLLAGRLMDEAREVVDEYVLDAVGEITNILAGRLKGELNDPAFGITNMSCPSIIIGADYHVYQFRGFQSVSVEFELGELPVAFWRERLFSTTVSLSRG